MIENVKTESPLGMTQIMIPTQTEQEPNYSQKILANMLDQKLQ